MRLLKKESIFVLVTIFFICLTTITGVYATDKQVPTEIATYKKDITGDNQPEKIQVIRTLDKKIEINIITPDEKKYKISLAGEQKPTISFKDLNQDHVKDIFIANPGKDGVTPSEEYLLYSFNDEQLSKIELPEALTLTTQYENDYKASILINQSGIVYTIDLHDRKTSLEQMGLYQNGFLNEPTELMVNSIENLKPVRLKDLTVGLKGRQPVGDAYNEDIIAYVESTWKWTNGTWEMQKTVVKKTNKK